MSRPHIVRADSIDLQDLDRPSAKDHTKGHTNSSSTLAPHQAETLREIAQETKEENLRSPRVSWSGAGDGVGDLQQYAEDLAAGIANSLNGHGQGNDRKKMHQQDALAVAQNGGVQDDSDLDVDGDDDDGMDDDMMDKISSSPSIEDEDIDFEFVYALHTFVATVEGQANATKGDTMVLLDDSNSYWWLVRVVKDSSIGYLPAEHIETPTERLARLNKHRNIDLSAAMLGDSQEKSKNTFKSAIRRRKKTVAFAAPTYVDYSDIDYSTDEEEVEEMFARQQMEAREQQAQQAAAQQVAEEAMDDDSAKVEPLKPRSQKEVMVSSESAKEDEREDDPKRTSEDIFDNKSDGVSRSRNGTVRNTDSFFKDDTVETKKITLTPNLLRDDNTPRASTDSKELRQRPSLDKMDKDPLLDRGKDDKKRKDKDKKDKDKKPSVIRNFFSRKDKKKTSEEDDDSFGKRSIDIVTEQRERDIEEVEDMVLDKNGVPQRHPSKLQKQQPRTEPSPTRKGVTGPPQKSPAMELASYLAETRNDVSNVPPASMRILDPETKDAQESPQRGDADASRPAASSQKEDRPGLYSTAPRTDAQASKPSTVGPKSSREVDVSSDEDTSPAQQASQEKQRQERLQRPTIPGAFPDSYQTTSSAQSDKTVTAPSQQQPTERLSESPVQVSPVTSNDPPALMVDTSSQDGHSESPSPELIEASESSGARHRAQDSLMTTSTSGGSSNPSDAWNDAKLRAFFDSSSDIRDMLVVVYDKTDVAPAGPDHPIAGSLFREQNARLAEITTQLDNMLGDWLARKQRLRGTV